jgi:hypothetical protein
LRHLGVRRASDSAGRDQHRQDDQALSTAFLHITLPGSNGRNLVTPAAWLSV